MKGELRINYLKYVAGKRFKLIRRRLDDENYLAEVALSRN
jgi:hypothetical protein